MRRGFRGLGRVGCVVVMDRELVWFAFLLILFVCSYVYRGFFGIYYGGVGYRFVGYFG